MPYHRSSAVVTIAANAIAASAIATATWKPTSPTPAEATAQIAPRYRPSRTPAARLGPSSAIPSAASRR